LSRDFELIITYLYENYPLTFFFFLSHSLRIPWNQRASLSFLTPQIWLTQVSKH